MRLCECYCQGRNVALVDGHAYLTRDGEVYGFMEYQVCPVCHVIDGETITRISL